MTSSGYVSMFTATTLMEEVQDCSALSICLTSGVYKVNLTPNDTFDVYCDMDTDGGGWTVLQRRTDGSEDFYRGWTEYAEGFGNLINEFWLGNKKINQITTNGVYRLRVELEDFEGNTRYALYSRFSVGDLDSDFTLSICGYSGNAGDGFTGPTTNHNLDGLKFSTFDKDNDNYNANCAVNYKGGWWYNHCHQSNLNGMYLQGPHESNGNGVNWYLWHGYKYSLKYTKMMIKREH